MGVRDTWGPGENIAKCLYHPLFNEPHSAPYVGCGCGFWAYWEPTYVPKALWQPTYSTLLTLGKAKELYFVSGIIEGYGRSLIGDIGIRCEKVEF